MFLCQVSSLKMFINVKAFGVCKSGAFVLAVVLGQPAK